MPGYDGSGPLGRGNIDGRGAGYCDTVASQRIITGNRRGGIGSGYVRPRAGLAGPRAGIGAGFGGGYRRVAWGQGFARPEQWVIDNTVNIDTQQEIQMLESEAELLQQQINDIYKRIDALKKEV